jgi:hypothetical protein
MSTCVYPLNGIPPVNLVSQFNTGDHSDSEYTAVGGVPLNITSLTYLTLNAHKLLGATKANAELSYVLVVIFAVTVVVLVASSVMVVTEDEVLASAYTKLDAFKGPEYALTFITSLSLMLSYSHAASGVTHATVVLPSVLIKKCIALIYISAFK